ncbi:DUF1003 domain-containing protein (plasmid) [Kovacikia minuta CCNUW1]|uniref:DUF1003 domain-containing protein n=1 Tax=Kovacikia minuta TaxID=2931930 RepID=UPI001CCA6C20|nr:DUF1003 domain-containing protein [Kovacikia minuta]UBF30567.1 DUF1003 domain-containing protein [Kovacikia minuta CCNUW1]
MNSNQPIQTEHNVKPQAAVLLNQPESTNIQSPAKKPSTFGQRLADRLASKVGSWPFLIGQSTILAGWIGFNLMPGVPHWDEQPFILLNLVFSFASAYTAPIVLMSQNRQSEEDRESANHNYQINLQAAQNIRLLQEKLDTEYSQKLDELSTLIKQHQQATSEVKVVFVPTQSATEAEHEYSLFNPISTLRHQPKKMAFVNVEKGESLTSNLGLDEVEVIIGK